MRHHRVDATLNVGTDTGRQVWKVLAKTEAVSALRDWIGRIA